MTQTAMLASTLRVGFETICNFQYRLGHNLRKEMCHEVHSWLGHNRSMVCQQAILAPKAVISLKPADCFPLATPSTKNVQALPEHMTSCCLSDPMGHFECSPDCWPVLLASNLLSLYSCAWLLLGPSQHLSHTLPLLPPSTFTIVMVFASVSFVREINAAVFRSGWEFSNFSGR